jgi:hypothetical protein
MTSFLKSAKFISDVELGCDIVEVEYTKYVEGENRYETFVDLCRVKDLGMGKAHGQVYLDGEVLQLHIFMRREKERLERLLKK